MFSFRGLLRYLSVFLLFYSILLVSFFFWGSDAEYNTNQKIARGYISEKSIFFDVHDPSKKTAKYLNYVIDEDGSFKNLGNVDIDFNTNEVDLTPYEGEDPDYILTNDILPDGLTKIEAILSSGSSDYLAAVHTGLGRGVYYSGDALIPPVIEGRFLTEEECLSDEPLTVIGKEYKEDIFTENGNDYIDYLGKKYQVIGIVGTEEDSTLDSLVFVNLGSMEPDIQLQGRYYVDSRKSTEKCYEKINNKAMELYGYDLDRCARPETLIDIVSNGLYLKSYLKILSILMALFLYISILIQSIGMNKNTIGIMKTVGIRFDRMFIKVNLRILIIALLGIVLGIITDCGLIIGSVFDLSASDMTMSLIVISGISFGLLALWTLIVALYNNRLNPGECLRDL